MPLNNEQLTLFENWIAQGKTQEVLDSLFKLKEETAYKPEILALNNLWQNLKSEHLMGSLSDEEHRIAQGKLNAQSLLLVSFLKREKNGIKKRLIEGLSPEPQKTIFTILRPHIPWVLSAIVAGLLAWQFTAMSYEEVCNDGGAYLNGSWNMKWLEIDKAKPPIYGTATILQDSCFQNFKLTAQFEPQPDSKLPPLSFSTKIGGYSGREIYFIYENSRRERGACHGVLLNGYKDKFELECSDIVAEGDTSNGSVGVIIFSKKPFDRTKDGPIKDASSAN